VKKFLALLAVVVAAGYGYVYRDRRKKRGAPTALLGVVSPRKEMFE